MANGLGKKVTISDLAGTLGLSKSSVSYALNGVPGVSDDTRRRVLALADELGWRPHAGARALRLQRAMTVGIALARDPQQIASEPFYQLVLSGIFETLQKADYSLLLRIIGAGASAMDLYRVWAERHLVDGIIMFDAELEDVRVEALGEFGLPLVLMGEFDATAGVSNVTGCATTEAELLLQHLADLGHHRVGFVSGPQQLRHELLRLQALTASARRLGLDLQISQGDYTVAGGEQAAQTLLAGHPRPTAVIGASDLTVLGVANAAATTGLAIPDQLAIASWDDSLLMQVSSPAVTALFRDPMTLGRLAAELLLDCLAGAHPQTRQAPAPTLIPRGSTVSDARLAS